MTTGLTWVELAWISALADLTDLPSRIGAIWFQTPKFSE